MSDWSLREYLAGDIPAMGELWQDTFGDPEQLTSGFFRLLPELGSAIVAVRGTELLGMGYVLDDLFFDDGKGRKKRCAYIYAVAVAEEARSLGIGRAICRSLAELGKKRGAEILCTLPAEESLYAWYESILGLSCALRREGTLVPAENKIAMWPISPADYGQKREGLLPGRAHLSPGPATLEFAGAFYGCFGGGLYACADGVCAAYRDLGRAYVKDMVCPAGSEADMAASVGVLLGAKDVVYYLPAGADGDSYIAALPGTLPADCLWNLSFD